MREPSAYEKFHWKSFNVIAKIFGFCLSLASLTFIIPAIASIFGAKISEREYPIYLLPLFVILLVLGILVIRAKPYYPKKYREWFERKKKSSNQDKK